MSQGIVYDNVGVVCCGAKPRGCGVRWHPATTFIHVESCGSSCEFMRTTSLRCGELSPATNITGHLFNTAYNFYIEKRRGDKCSANRRRGHHASWPEVADLPLQERIHVSDQFKVTSPKHSHSWHHKYTSSLLKKCHQKCKSSLLKKRIVTSNFPYIRRQAETYDPTTFTYFMKLSIK